MANLNLTGVPGACRAALHEAGILLSHVDKWIPTFVGMRSNNE